MKKLGNRIWALIFFGIASNVGNVIYFPVMFYAAFQQVFGLTNTQIGSLTAAYASLAIPGYLLSGWIADKVNSKLLMSIATLSTTAVVFVMAMIPPYSVLLICFFVMSITLGLLFWSAFSKLQRMMGDSSEQGTITGLVAAVDGIISLVFMVGMVALLGDKLATPAGMRTLLLSFGVVYLIGSIGFIVTYDYKKFSSLYTVDSGEPVRLSNYAIGLKMPAMWICSIMNFGVYITSTAFNYINPYMANEYAMSAAMASIFGILIRYGIKIVATPIGGMVRDKIGNTSKVIIYTALPSLILTVVFMLLPRGAGNTVIAVTVALVLTFIYRLGNNLTYVPYADLNVPINVLGTAMGLSTFFGYCSDWFLPTMIGRWLDIKGGNAYYYVFGVAVVGLSLFMLGAVLLMKELKKQAQAAGEQK